jgi:hypothetical protein
MICLDDLEAFVWILRFTEVTFELCFNMMFELMGSRDTPLAPKVQQQVLDPFLNLQVKGQKCSIKGATDAAWAADMQERMAPVIHWTRTYCWEYFDVNRYIKDLGD